MDCLIWASHGQIMSRCLIMQVCWLYVGRLGPCCLANWEDADPKTAGVQLAPDCAAGMAAG